MRNILANFPHKEERPFATQAKQNWLQPGKKSAQHTWAHFVQEYSNRFLDAMPCKEENLEDSLQFYKFLHACLRVISSPAILKRTGREIGCRCRWVAIFSFLSSLFRLYTCYLMEYSAKRPADRSYIKHKKVQAAME